MKKNKTIAIIGALHGNEGVGVEVIKNLTSFLRRRAVGIIANTKALKKNVRFIDQDLNRSFPGRSDGNYEERLAKRLLKRVKDLDYVLDLHSFSCKSPPFAILTKKTKEHLRLVRASGVKKVIFMSPKLASGKALIDHCRCGVSIETGRHGFAVTISRATHYTKNVLRKLESQKGGRTKTNGVDFFEITDIFLKKGNEELVKNITNFKLITKGQIFAKEKEKEFTAPYDFYPVFAGEKAYPNILCLVARNDKTKGDEYKSRPILP